MLGTSKSVWGFDPRTVPGCQLWLDAADTATVVQSSGSITQWNDKSTSALTATAVNNPTLVANVQNGLPGVSLNGSNQYFNLGNNLNMGTNQLYMFIVSKFNTTADGAVIGKSLLGGGVGRYSLLRVSGILTPLAQGTGGGNDSGVNSDTNTSVRILNMIWDRNTITLYQNGSSVFSVGLSDSSNVTNNNSLLIGAYQNSSGGTPPAGGLYMNGFIHEILLYFTPISSPLTTAQRQQVEGYLGHKWGLVAPSPTVPLSVPGCQLWLDGADPAGTGTPPADGATVSTWVDKSGNGYNATAAPSRTAGTYSTSFRAVNFPNSTTGYITNYSAAPTNETMFVVFNNPSPSGNNNIIIGGVSGARSLGAGFTAAGTGTVGNLNTQVVWLASTGPYTAGTTVFTTSQFTPSSNSVSLNGGTFSTGGAPGFTAGRVTYLGVDATSPVYYYIGYAMEILFYNSILTTTQRQTIETYLAKKWSIGSTSMIPSSHPFYSIRPHLRVFRPTDVPGCLLWLDGADTGSMTLSGSSVTQWMDKSGRGFNVATSSGATAPLYNSSTKELQFVSGNSNSFTIPQAFGNALVGTTFSFFFIGRRTVNTTYVYFLSGATSAGNQNLFIGFLSNKMEIGEYGPYASADIPTFSSPDPMRLYYYDIQSSTTANLIMNGNPLSTTVSGNLFLTSFAQPELGRRYGGAVYHDFNLSEMVVFSPALTTSQRQQIEGYLAHKWGLIASFTNPLSIPGCALWLDGTDPAGTRTPPADGATISTWVDKSGSGNSLTAVGSPTYVSASSSVYLNGSYLQNTNFNSTSYTLFIVSKQTSGNGPLYTNNTTTNGYTGFFPNYDGAYYLVQADNSWLSGGSPFANGTTYLYSIQYDSSNNINVWTNGNSTPTITGTAGTITRNQFILGKRDGNYNIGNIFEVIQYNTTLTTTQRQTIERYLAKKWSIGSTSSSLASTHPFSNFPPASVHSAERFPLIRTSELIVKLDGASYSAGGSTWKDSVASANWTMSGTTYDAATQTVVFSSSYAYAPSVTNFNSSAHTVVMYYYRTGNSPNPTGLTTTGAILYQIARGPSDFETEIIVGEPSMFEYYGGFTLSFNANTSLSGTTGWVMRAFVKNGGTGTFYLNGVADGTQTSGTAVPTANRDFCFGRDYRDGNGFLQGKVALFAMWNVGLSASDIAAVHANCRGQFGL